jgi:hypothetical protein
VRFILTYSHKCLNDFLFLRSPRSPGIEVRGFLLGFDEKSLITSNSIKIKCISG